MTNRQTPPGRKSKACIVVRNPFGPHHCTRCLGSIQTEKTSPRGAASTRVPTIERASWSRSMLFFIATLLLPFAFLDRLGLLFALFPLRLKNPEVAVETIQSLFPKATIFLEPVIGLFQRFRIDTARTHLCVARARDQARALENLQMLGNRRQADVERLGEFQHRGL